MTYIYSRAGGNYGGLGRYYGLGDDDGKKKKKKEGGGRGYYRGRVGKRGEGPGPGPVAPIMPRPVMSADSDKPATPQPSRPSGLVANLIQRFQEKKDAEVPVSAELSPAVAFKPEMFPGVKMPPWMLPKDAAQAPQPEQDTPAKELPAVIVEPTKAVAAEAVTTVQTQGLQPGLPPGLPFPTLPPGVMLPPSRMMMQPMYGPQSGMMPKRLPSPPPRPVITPQQARLGTLAAALGAGLFFF